MSLWVMAQGVSYNKVNEVNDFCFNILNNGLKYMNNLNKYKFKLEF